MFEFLFSGHDSSVCALILDERHSGGRWTGLVEVDCSDCVCSLDRGCFIFDGVHEVFCFAWILILILI